MQFVKVLYSLVPILQFDLFFRGQFLVLFHDLVNAFDHFEARRKVSLCTYIFTNLIPTISYVATGWKVLGSKPGGGARYSTSVQTVTRPTQLPVQQVSGLFPEGQSGRGVALATPLHPALMLKKE
jgi:hypothetical protein